MPSIYIKIFGDVHRRKLIFSTVFCSIRDSFKEGVRCHTQKRHYKHLVFLVLFTALLFVIFTMRFARIVYIHQPIGFVGKTRPKHVYLLRQSLYGFKQVISCSYHQFISVYPPTYIGYFLHLRDTSRLSNKSYDVICLSSKRKRITSSVPNYL